MDDLKRILLIKMLKKAFNLTKKETDSIMKTKRCVVITKLDGCVYYLEKDKLESIIGESLEKDEILKICQITDVFELLNTDSVIMELAMRGRSSKLCRL